MLAVQVARTDSNETGNVTRLYWFSGTTFKRQELLIHVFLATGILLSGWQIFKLFCPWTQISHHSVSYNTGTFFLRLSSRCVRYNYKRNKFPSEHLPSVVCLTGQHLSTSGGHLQANSIKYMKVITYNCIFSPTASMNFMYFKLLAWRWTFE